MKTDELIAMAAKTAAEIQERKQAAAQREAQVALQTKPMPQTAPRPMQPQVPSPAQRQQAVTAPAPTQPVAAPSMETPQRPPVQQKSQAPAAVQQPTPQAPQRQTDNQTQRSEAPQQVPAQKPAAPSAMPAPAVERAPATKSMPTAKAAAASAAVANSGDGMAPAEPTKNWHDDLPTGNRKVVSKGLIFIFGFLGLFLLWAFLFPISSAVVAPGKIVSAGANKLIQHPVGGVVRDIFVRDGDTVAKDQVIMTLDPSVNQAELGRLSARFRMLSAMQARLTSENGDAGFSTTVPGLQLRGTQSDELVGAEGVATTQDDPLLDQQRREFEAGRKRLAAETEAANSLIESLRDERSGQQARMAGEKRLLNFTNMEISKVRPLANEGLLPKARLWELEKKRLEQITTVSNLEATIDATTQRIAEAEAKLEQLTEADREKRSEELTRVIGELGEIKDQIAAARVSLKSTELKAPVAGVLTKMTANTVGGVVKSGDPIAEIVPGTSDLITEFRVPLDKVKSVAPGQKARIVVTAFNRRTYDPIEGEVIYVAADSQLDPVTQETFFLARARLNANPDKNNGVGEIQAGMPTEVYALSTPRVFMSYVFQPVYDSFDKAFREIN